MKIEVPSSKREIAAVLGTTNAILNRWMRENRAMLERIDSMLPKPKPKKIPEAQRALTAEEIDEILLDSIGDSSERLRHQLRKAIRQLRAEKRALMSEINRTRAAEHVRKARSIPVHASTTL